MRTNIIIPSNTQLLSKKANSRLMSDSISLSALSLGSLQIIKAAMPMIRKPMYQTKYCPMSDRANECTLAMRPERVRKVPKIVRKNVKARRKTFHTLIMCRRS
jgi:hypothetical protein